MAETTRLDCLRFWRGGNSGEGRAEFAPGFVDSGLWKNPDLAWAEGHRWMLETSKESRHLEGMEWQNIDLRDLKHNRQLYHEDIYQILKLQHLESKTHAKTPEKHRRFLEVLQY